MDNISFLEKILASTAEYWVVAKKNHYSQYLETKRGTDSIILIAVPLELSDEVMRPAKIDELSLGELRKINSRKIKENIYFTENYPPFQYGLSLSSFYDGFPLEGVKQIKEFIIKGLQLESNDWLEYKKLAESLKEPKSE